MYILIFLILHRHQLPTDWRRVKTPPVVSICGVCTHIYIYVVCEPRHGESTTSAALYYIRDSGFYMVLYIHNEQSSLPSHQAPHTSLSPFPRRVDSCTVCSCLRTSPCGLATTPTPPSHFPQESTAWSLLYSLL
jgi:hypothetical protein